MTELRIRLLGGLEVTVGGRTVTDFESATARALLARLAAEPGRPLARTLLAELLWPDRPSGAAAGNLRHCLSTVRKAIGDTDPDHPILVASRNDITLDAGPAVSVDLSEFGRLSTVPASEPGAVASWEAAVELRRGPFLAGFDAPLSEAWDTWLLTMRTAVDDATTSALQRLAELRERTGEHRRALDHVRRWTDLDPWNERGHRAMIRLLALEDQRGAALRHADELAATLQVELGIEPGPETRALVDDIREGRFPVIVPEVPTLPPRLVTDTAREPCVGRTAELAWLNAQLDGALTGSGRVAFVVGQPGSGKTVLLHAFERHVLDAMPNVRVIEGRCIAHRDLGEPFLPFRQVLGQLLGDFDLDWATGRLTPSAAADLWRGVPAAVEALLDHGSHLLGTLVDAGAVCARFEAGYPDHHLVPRLRAATEEARQRSLDQTRRRQPLVEQCARVLAAVAMQRPLVITVDDLQWADSGTLDVLASISAKIGGVSMLVVAARRPGELGPAETAGVGATVNEIVSRAPDACQLELSGTSDFVDAWLDAEPNLFDQSFRDRVYRSTGGNPLFTVELVRALKESGQVARDERGRWCVHRLPDSDDLPPRVEATIATRLAALPAELRRDLEAASLSGHEFSAQVVAEAREVPVHDVILRLSSLCSAPSSLLRPGGAETVDGTRFDRFRFRHALFQQHLADHLAPAVARQLHESIGRALEKLFAESVERVGGDLALHFDAAGVAEKAVTYHQVAGSAAARLCAYEAAVHHFERALELLPTLEPSVDGEKQQLVLLTSLGACHQAQFGYTAPETTAVYDQLRELTREIAPSLESAAAIGGLLTVDGLRARYTEALAEAEQLLDLAFELDSVPIETVARVQLGWMLLMVGRIVEADEQLTLAIDRYDAAWDTWLTPLVGMHVPSTAEAWRSITAWHLGNVERARESGDRSIELARTARFPFGLAFALAIGGGLAGTMLDEPDRTAGAATEMASIAREEDFAFYRAAAEIHAGLSRVGSDDPLGGVEQIRRGLQGWAAIGSAAFVTWCRVWLAEALVRAGELDAARAELAEIDALLRFGEEQIAELRRLYVAGMLQAAEGDVEGAAENYRQLISSARAARARGPEQQARAALAALGSVSAD